jgi:hypothetical protein
VRRKIVRLPVQHILQSEVIPTKSEPERRRCAHSTTAAVFDSEHTGDISLAMTLSDSENEGDQNMVLYGTRRRGNDEDDDDTGRRKSGR